MVLLYIKYLLYFAALLGLFSLWIYKGIAETGIHVDLARDLNFLSDIWVHKIVWLGPMTSANFPTPPVYYYLLFPGLFLSGGNGYSLIISHAFFALLALGLFIYFQLNKSFLATLLVILTIGLSPWWIRSSTLPWNGHMYVAFVFLALTSLWFKKHFLLSAILFGTSIAINPVAIFALPVLFYEWWVSKKRKWNLLYIILGILLPWTPIIIFEIITKGFLIRQWLQHPSSGGLSFSQSLNTTLLLNTLAVSKTIAIISWLVAFATGTKRDRYWIIFVSLPLLSLPFISSLRDYYLFGLTCALSFTVATVLSSKTIGKIILVILILSYTQMIKIPPISYTDRSIYRLDRVVDTFIQNTRLDPAKKYAVVSIRDPQNSTPQADDFRFFLRMRGINALNIDQYPEAQILLLFVEVPKFNWRNFEDWHTQRFGNRKLISAQNIDGIEIVMYGRK